MLHRYARHNAIPFPLPSSVPTARILPFLPSNPPSALSDSRTIKSNTLARRTLTVAWIRAERFAERKNRTLTSGSGVRKASRAEEACSLSLSLLRADNRRTLIPPP